MKSKPIWNWIRTELKPKTVERQSWKSELHKLLLSLFFLCVCVCDYMKEGGGGGIFFPPLNDYFYKLLQFMQIYVD